MTFKQKVGWIGGVTGSWYAKRTLGLDPDRRCRLRYDLVVGEVHRGLSAVWPPWVFCTITVPGEGVEPSWTRGPRDFESRASTSFTTPASGTTPFYVAPADVSSAIAREAEGRRWHGSRGEDATGRWGDKGTRGMRNTE